MKKSKLTLSIEIEGDDKASLEDALNEVRSKVEQGYYSGFDENDTSCFSFRISQDD